MNRSDFLRTIRHSAVLAAIALPLLSVVELRAQTPAEVAEEILAADRASAAAAGDTGLIEALADMFSADVIVPAPGGAFLRGKEEAVEALRANPANAGVRASWEPIRAGVSADGLHGFTFGYMTAQADTTQAHFKYMTYWERQPDGWRARAWKRAPREAFEPPAATMVPALPAALVAPETDPDAIRAHEASLAEAESAFSRDAQSIGLAAAFARYGSADAVNMGPRSGPYVVGAETIGRLVGEGEPAGGSSVSWAPDEAVIVASSGDLGITFGRIRSNDPASDSPPFPFFTIWRRASPDAPWRYVAE